MLELLKPETRRRFLKQISGASVVFAIGPKITAWAETAPTGLTPTAASVPVQTADVQMKVNRRDVEVKDLQLTIGSVAECKCNGEVIEKAMKVGSTGGIGLQAETGKFEFRRIRIKEQP